MMPLFFPPRWRKPLETLKARTGNHQNIMNYFKPSYYELTIDVDNMQYISHKKLITYKEPTITKNPSGKEITIRKVRLL